MNKAGLWVFPTRLRRGGGGEGFFIELANICFDIFVDSASQNSYSIVLASSKMADRSSKLNCSLKFRKKSWIVKSTCRCN